jgi:hypothetical protein
LKKGGETFPKKIIFLKRKKKNWVGKKELELVLVGPLALWVPIKSAIGIYLKTRLEELIVETH